MTFGRNKIGPTLWTRNDNWRFWLRQNFMPPLKEAEERWRIDISFGQNSYRKGNRSLFIWKIWNRCVSILALLSSKIWEIWNDNEQTFGFLLHARGRRTEMYRIDSENGTKDQEQTSKITRIILLAIFNWRNWHLHVFLSSYTDAKRSFSFFWSVMKDR